MMFNGRLPYYTLWTVSRFHLPSIHAVISMVQAPCHSNVFPHHTTRSNTNRYTIHDTPLMSRLSNLNASGLTMRFTA